MTKFSQDDVKKVAKSLRIQIPEEEIGGYAEQLGLVMDNLEVFEELDLEEVEETSQVTGLTNVLRKDEAEEYFTEEDVFLNAENRNGYFVVRKVFSD